MSFPALSRIKPQAPLLVVPFRQFLQVSALRPYFPRNPDTPVSRRAPPPRPGRRTSRGGAPSNVRRRRRGRHRLRSELRRYLIVFEPPTFAPAVRCCEARPPKGPSDKGFCTELAPRRKNGYRFSPVGECHDVALRWRAALTSARIPA